MYSQFSQNITNLKLIQVNLTHFHFNKLVILLQRLKFWKHLITATFSNTKKSQHLFFNCYNFF